MVFWFRGIYFLVWIGFSLVATLVQWAIERAVEGKKRSAEIPGILHLSVDPLPTMHPSGEMWANTGHPVNPEKLRFEEGEEGRLRSPPNCWGGRDLIRDRLVSIPTVYGSRLRCGNARRCNPGYSIFGFDIHRMPVDLLVVEPSGCQKVVRRDNEQDVRRRHHGSGHPVLAVQPSPPDVDGPERKRSRSSLAGTVGSAEDHRVSIPAAGAQNFYTISKMSIFL
jgi:hypothetical protein